MQRSTDRFLTTHTGSLPRPADLVAILNARELGGHVDAPAFTERVRRAIVEVVQRQAATGLDVIGDGEHGKVNWMAYARERLAGLEEIDSPPRFRGATRDSLAFAAAYEDARIMLAAPLPQATGGCSARPAAERPGPGSVGAACPRPSSEVARAGC